MDTNKGKPWAPFDPVPLPAGEPGNYETGALDKALRDWATSAPVRTLASASGWDWPSEQDTLMLLERLADLSSDWDFRKNRERNFIEDAPAVVNGRTIPDDLVVTAARALGMVNSTAVTGRKFSHLVVLSGLVSACVNRTHWAAELMNDGLAAGKVAVLSAHRALGGNEPLQAAEMGLGDVADEAEAMVGATRRAFGLGDPVTVRESPPLAGPADNAALYASWALYQWPSIEVIIAPSAEPETRRANTADQLRYWADLAGVGNEHDVLILTTQHYVPYQHLETIRVLGLERGCRISSCGVDAARSLIPRTKPLGGRDYLQEIRSALRAAPALLRAARQGR